MKTSIIIPLYKSRPHVAKLVKSLNGFAPAANRVWVNDGENEDYLSLVHLRRGVPSDALLENHPRLGFSGSCNRGAASAIEYEGSDYLCLLNADTWLTEGCLQKLEAVLDTLPDVAIAAPVTLKPAGNVDSAGSFWNHQDQVWDHHNAVDLNSAILIERDMVTFAAVVIRRSVWEELGGLDERYNPAYWEDADFCMRVREKGYKIVVVPNSHVYHVGNSSGLGGGRGESANRERYLKTWVESGRQFKFVPRPKERLVLMRYRGKGDVLMATSLVNRIALKYPGRYEIDFATEEPEILAGHPHIARIITPYEVNQSSFWQKGITGAMLNTAYESRPGISAAEAFALEASMPELNAPELIAAGRPRIYPGENEKAYAERIEKLMPKPLIAVHYAPGVWPCRNWPHERWMQVVKAMEADGYSVVSLPTANLPGINMVLGSAALLARCRLFIGIDSFPAHLAQAVDCPAVILFGPTSPTRLLHGDPTITRALQGADADGCSCCDFKVSRGTSLRPCQRPVSGYSPCMLSIMPSQVLIAAKEIIRAL